MSPPAVLVRRQPFIGPVGQGCRMGCQLHVNFKGDPPPILGSARGVLSAPGTGGVPKPPYNILLPSGQLVFGRDAHTNSFDTRM